jgi:hypothetical protein
MSLLALLEHHAKEDFSVPSGWKKSRQSQLLDVRFEIPPDTPPRFCLIFRIFACTRKNTSYCLILE